MVEVKLIADSVFSGKRITTVTAKYPRFIHAQVMTYRVFSRNGASSRAIPVGKFIETTLNETAYPIKYGKNKPGMLAEEYLSPEETIEADLLWADARDAAIHWARKLYSIGVHKQTVNRLLEPFQHMTLLITATDWDNFFEQRLADDAQPEIQEIARQIKSTLDKSVPEETSWHIPFGDKNLRHDECIKQAVARCARVSYLNHDGTTSLEKDTALYEKLHKDKHMSPFEHVAYASPGRWDNFTGWRSWRNHVEAYRNREKFYNAR